MTQCSMMKYIVSSDIIAHVEGERELVENFMHWFFRLDFECTLLLPYMITETCRDKFGIDITQRVDSSPIAYFMLFSITERNEPI